MPLPAIIGVGFLAGFLGNLFASAVDFFTKKVGKKIAVRIVFGTVVVGMMITFIGVCQALIASLSFVLPTEYSMILVNIVPDNTSTCLSAVITANVSRRLYDLKVKASSRTWLGI